MSVVKGPQSFPIIDRGVKRMTSDEAGRPEDEGSGLEISCLHQRMIEYQYDEQGKRTGKFVCKECAAIILDPADRRV
ncbi:hypothetical protein [Candidatus Nitronereus thalassa]|uniref:Uncharacterized protein n=1 Tax=Candidatus Nitronereus thalassa TaxID=3020898 RepID=A0ABU3K8U7_9BACT|nr:hypothetical protein [Candidatus Nitronereus thalassa]MDT7042797.1 hypothetical protein [Candidatus Nitronereus thalassa]